MSKYLGIAYNLRLPPELKEKIQESAKQLNRSMNADIVARLEQSFEKDDAAEFDKEFVLQVIQNQQATIQDLTDQIKHLKMSFDVLTKELHAKKNRI
ncbi:Arc family DNA-binding protein [Acinetobacter johnsonii]|uniref:Arc family DNA-binding protein n=1 Tax=Acinetobacter johnsonii TaxID=40214 RepID=UPI002446EF31|nr:Arc family DNA-binding protein [Acinetobacter johnsonii]MDH0711958.1 Arc family DNA-binding protein [Acinetobacter johnsonii]